MGKVLRIQHVEIKLKKDSSTESILREEVKKVIIEEVMWRLEETKCRTISSRKIRQR